MVIGRRGVSAPLLMGIALALVVIIVLVIVFLPEKGKQLTLQVAVQGTPTAGEDLVLQLTIESDKARDTTLVGELFNLDRQLVNIVRERHTLEEGSSVIVLRVSLPEGLPQGRYIGMVTARYAKGAPVTQEVSVRVLKKEEEQVPVTPESEPPSPEPTAPEAEPITITPAPEPAAPVPEPGSEPQPHRPVEGLPAFIETDDIVEFSHTDKNAAIQKCLALTPPEDQVCVSKIAVEHNDDFACTRLSSEYDQDKCYLSLASAGNPATCSFVQDPALRATCDAVAKFYAPGGSS